MSYIQLVSPNLSTVGDAGWCLWVAEEAFGVPHLDASAEDAWNACHFPHPSEQPPDAIVPVYWTFFDAAENIEFGHIAIWVPGRGVFSSPFNVTHGSQWFPSIQAVTDRINQIRGANSRYLGWSEDLAGESIIKEANMPTLVDANILEDLSVGLLGRTSVGDKNLANLIGVDVASALATFIRYPEHQAVMDHAGAYDSDQAKIAELTAQLKNVPTPTDPNSVTVTQTGLWAAFKRFLGL